MKESEYISLHDVVTFVNKLILYALHKWKLLCIIGFLGGIAGFIYASTRAPTYEARLTFTLNENESGGGMNLSSLAGLAGLPGAASNNVNEDKLLFIANSRTLIGSTLLCEEELYGHKKMLANHYIDLNGLLNEFKSDTTLATFKEFTHHKLDDFTYRENKAMDIIVRAFLEHGLFTIESKKKAGIVAQGAGIITMNLKTGDELFSERMLERLYETLSNYYINRSIQRQLRNYNLIRDRADSIQAALAGKETYGAVINDKNQRTVRMQGRLELERIRRDVEILNIMYGEVIKNREVAKFALDNQTPFFQVIDRPTLPLIKKKVSRMWTAIGGALLAGMLGFTVLLIFNRKTIFLAYSPGPRGMIS